MVDRKAFDVFDRKVLREILSGRQEVDIWRRRMNHESYQVYKEVDIIKLIKYSRLRWAGHVVRMPEERQAKIISSREPGRGYQLGGRPRTGWLFAVRSGRLEAICSGPSLVEENYPWVEDSM